MEHSVEKVRGNGKDKHDDAFDKILTKKMCKLWYDCLRNE